MCENVIIKHIVFLCISSLYILCEVPKSTKANNPKRPVCESKFNQNLIKYSIIISSRIPLIRTTTHTLQICINQCGKHTFSLYAFDPHISHTPYLLVDVLTLESILSMIINHQQPPYQQIRHNINFDCK